MLLPEIAQEIEDNALATRGTDLFLGVLPPNPSSCCALVEYTGEEPLRTQNEGAAGLSAQGSIRPRVQLLCRASAYETGRSLIEQIWRALDVITNQELSGTFYQSVRAMQSPFLLDRDENDRYIFAANFAITKHA